MIKKAATLSAWPFTRLARCLVSKVIMTVNCHVFQLVPYSDLQVSSANHFCIRKYLLVIVLIIIIFLIILKLIHSGYHAVGSIVEQHHLAAAVKLQKMNCSAIHKTCASLCLCTKVHFLEKKKKVFWQMGLLSSEPWWVAGCHASKCTLTEVYKSVDEDKPVWPNLVCC